MEARGLVYWDRAWRSGVRPACLEGRSPQMSLPQQCLAWGAEGPALHAGVRGSEML